MAENIRNLVIIGSGPAGLTAGIYAARANLHPLIFEGTKPGGQLMGTTYVENWPGEKSILGPKLMQNIKDHALHFGCEFIPEEIVHVDFSQRPFTLTSNKNRTIKAHAVIIASGSSPRRLGVPGEDEYWGKGVTTCAACDGAFYKDKKVVIVGGGDTAMEDASFMTKFTQDITIVQNFDHLTASHAMQQRVTKKPAISIIYESSITAVQGDGDHLTGVTIKNLKTGEETKKEASALFLAIGLNPNTAPFKGHLELTDYGHIRLQENTQTSVPGVFAAGDVADNQYRQAIVSAGTGCQAAFDAERYLQRILP